MIDLVNVGMEYDGEDILKSISYKFEKGMVYGLIGKNGAGKTTLLKIIMRLITKNTGSVFINKKKVDNEDYLNIESIFIGDSAVFYSDLTIAEQMLLVCKFEGLKKEEALSRINIMLEKLKLIKYKNYYPDTLSKGTLQRVNIALGMLRKYDVLLMDEPFNALDPVQVKAVEELILEYKKLKKTFIVSSHDLDSLNSICDRYLVLKNGVLLDYKPSELNKETISQLIGDSYGE